MAEFIETNQAGASEPIGRLGCLDVGKRVLGGGLPKCGDDVLKQNCLASEIVDKDLGPTIERRVLAHRADKGWLRDISHDEQFKRFDNLRNHLVKTFESFEQILTS